MTATWAGETPAPGLAALAGRGVADLLSDAYARRRHADLAGEGERLAAWATPANLSRLQLLLEHVASGAPVTDPTLQRYARDVAGDAERLRLRWEALAATESRAAWDREAVAADAPLWPRWRWKAVVTASLWASYCAVALALASVVGIIVSRALWLAAPP